MVNTPPDVTLPPQSIDAERAVLGALLIEGAAGYRRLTALVRPEQFLLEAHRDVFAAMIRLDGRHDPIDVLTVTEELRHLGRLDAVGGQAALALLIEQASILVHLPTYERLVVDEATKRDYLALSQRLPEASINGASPAELLTLVDEMTAYHRRQARSPRAPFTSRPGEASPSTSPKASP
jgi:replicative DNA helicase